MTGVLKIKTSTGPDVWTPIINGFSTVNEEIKYVTSDLNNSSITTYTTVTEWGTILSANTVWVFTGTIWSIGAATTTGITTRLTASQTPDTLRHSVFGSLTTTSILALATNASASALNRTASPSITNYYPIWVEGFIKTHATLSTTLTWEFRSEVDTSQITFGKGSTIKYTRLA